MLTLRPTDLSTAATHQPRPDWTVMSGGLRVGRIYEIDGPNDSAYRWYWALNGVHAGPDVMQITGMAPTFEEAKAAFGENWEKWKTWAKLTDEDYAGMLQNYRELAQGVRMIRAAVEQAFGLGVLPARDRNDTTPAEDCEAIVRAIHIAAGAPAPR